MKKRLKGFTLIELIVVIVIVGVLAAILVPSMIGFIGDSKLSTANTNAKLVYSTAMTYATKCETEGFVLTTEVSRESVQWPDSNRPDYVVNENGADILNAIRADMGSKDGSSGYCTLKVGSNGLPSDAYWAKTLNEKHVGRYPTMSTAKSDSTLPT